MNGQEKGGIKGSRKGIKYSFAGRQLNETEHHYRMGHVIHEDEVADEEEDDVVSGIKKHVSDADEAIRMASEI